MLVRDKISKQLVNITVKTTNTNYYKEILYCKYRVQLDEKHIPQVLAKIK